MDIHTMLANAATDIRAMELRIVHLQDEVIRVNQDNERLRQENAAITAARMHAEADLVHYQNVFVASVCVEAGSICREFFNLTQEKVRERAEGAIQKYVEERVNKEREENIFDPPNERELAESKVKVYSEDYEEFDKSIAEGYLTKEDEAFNESDKSLSELAPKTRKIQATYSTTPEGDTLIKPPAGCTWREAKQFWVRNSTALRPSSAEAVYAGFPLSSLKKDSPLILPDEKTIPSFLTEPRKEEPPTTLRAMIATVGF